MTQAEQKSEPAGSKAELVTPAAKAAALEEYRDRERFEHDLINRRLTWLLTSQSILFAAYGVVLREYSAGKILEAARFFLRTTAFIGLSVSSLILVGVVCAIAAKITAWKRVKDDIGKRPFPLGVSTKITFIAFAPDVLMPIIFASAWLWIYYHSPS